MKKSLFAIVLLLAVSMATTAFADTRFGQKGTWAVGGSAGFSSSSQDTGADDVPSTTAITFSPAAGYFISNGLLIGLAPSYTSTSYDSGASGADTVDSSTTGVSATVNYYHPLQGTLFIGGGAHLGYFTETTPSLTYDSTTGLPTGSSDFDTSGIGFGAHAGPTLAFGGKFGGFASLLVTYDYVTMTGDGDYESKNSSFGIGTELGIFF